MTKKVRKSVKSPSSALNLIDMSAQTEENLKVASKLYEDYKVVVNTVNFDETRNKFFKFQTDNENIVGYLNLLEQDGRWIILPFVDDENMHQLGVMTEMALKKVKAKEGQLTIIDPTEELIKNLIANEYEKESSYERDGVQRIVFKYSI